jgi:hypothetical protein
MMTMTRATLAHYINMMIGYAYRLKIDPIYHTLTAKQRELLHQAEVNLVDFRKTLDK